GRFRERRIEQLVSSPENRTAHDNVEAAGKDAAPRRRQYESEHARDPDDGRMGRDRTSEPETAEHETSERGLDRHCGQRRSRVEQSEEPDEMRTLSEVADGLGDR